MLTDFRGQPSMNKLGHGLNPWQQSGLYPPGFLLQIRHEIASQNQQRNDDQSAHHTKDDTDDSIRDAERLASHDTAKYPIDQVTCKEGPREQDNSTDGGTRLLTVDSLDGQQHGEAIGVGQRDEHGSAPDCQTHGLAQETAHETDQR